MTVVPLKSFRDELAALREENVQLKKEKERLCDVLFETTNALIRSLREPRK